MKTLVIGGTGFIGPFTIRQLQQAGHDISVFHRGRTSPPEDVKQVIGDRSRLSDYRDALAREKFDLVIDFVVSSERQARQLVETLRGITGRLVALSSGDVYRAMGVLRKTEPGPLQELPLTEESELRTRPHYSLEEIKAMHAILSWLDEDYEKVAMERALLSSQDLATTILRLPMVYGPGDYIHRFHPFLKRMDDGRPCILFAEDAAAWRTPRGYVEDVAAGIALAATSDRAAGCVYNIGEAECFSELEWAKKIAAATGWKGEFVVLPREKTPPHLVLPYNTAQHLVVSSARIREKLGYREMTAPAEAFQRTIAWERAHPPQGVGVPFNYEAEDAALANLKATA
jgi:nucleoside-diphosphate-sugar epimerase